MIRGDTLLLGGAGRGGSSVLVSCLGWISSFFLYPLLLPERLFGTGTYFSQLWVQDGGIDEMFERALFR